MKSKSISIVCLLGIVGLLTACGGGGGGSASPSAGSYTHVWRAGLNNGGQMVMRMNAIGAGAYSGVIEISNGDSCMNGTYTTTLSFVESGGYFFADAGGSTSDGAVVLVDGAYDPQTLTIQDGMMQAQRPGAGFGGSPYCDPQYGLLIVL